MLAWITARTTTILALTCLVAGCASGRVGARKQEAQPTHTWKQAVYFDFDQSDVREDARPVLDDVAGRIRSDEKAVAILEGHADPIGEADYNEALAEDRARSVRVYLRDQGADPHRITMTSKGEREPVAPGVGQRELQPNRRVDVILTLTGNVERKGEKQP
jgi:outer membrane protein OmpA-like peptidoglycan-associated protein